jgi:hypothetical protein
LVKQDSTIVLVHLGKLPVFDGLVLLASRAADLSGGAESCIHPSGNCTTHINNPSDDSLGISSFLRHVNRS